MKKNRRRVLITVLVLGWLLDFLFWRQVPGLNFAVYVVLCLASGITLLHLEGIKMSRRAIWLLPFILVFAATTFLRSEPLTVALAVLLCLFLMALLAISYTGGRWPEYNFADHALGLLRLGWHVLTEPLKFVATRDPDSRQGGRSAWPVLRGIVIALPVVMLFAALLGSADLVFQRQLDEFVKLLSLQRLPEYIFRFIYILLAAGALLGVLIHAASHSQDEKLLGGQRDPNSGALGFTEATIVLASVALLFAAFVLVQFRYFFGGQANISLEGFTYSEYARRGYGELMAVAFFSLLLILGLGAITRRDSAKRQRAFSLLSVLIVALVGVMLVSAYMRLQLYEAAYGFSRLRTYVHVSLLWLGVLLVAVVVLELGRRERFSAAAALLVAIGFGLTLPALNVDAFIVRQNVTRAIAGQQLDIPHLVSLSTDSIPPLAGLFASAPMSAETRESLGAALVCHINDPRSEARPEWRSFTLPSVRAARSLDSVRSDLGGYKFIEEDWFGRVITPGGASILCGQSWD